MKIIYKNLLNLIKENPSKVDLSKRLFQLGHEHEINGNIFEMELTPNRGDCFSVLGLARDLNVFYDFSNNIEIYNDELNELELDFENKAHESCSKVSFLEIEIEETPSSYEAYLENYFKELKINKTNFFADVSNYISYELGQPTHCFNRDRINGKIILDEKDVNESFTTLLGSDIKLEGKNLVFSDSTGVISLAGVMGGASTSCSENTKNVLIECAHFNPESILGKTIKYNLVSDAAHKFERGVDILSHEFVLRRFIKIISDHTKIKSIKMKSFENKKFVQKKIDIQENKINEILGTNLTKDIYLLYLSKLGFKISSEILIPTYRNDINTQNDLAEEIARIIGYDNIQSQPIKINFIDDNVSLKKEDYIRNFLIEHGFTEVINNPFTTESSKNSLTVDNPLDSNKKNLRLELKSSLLNNLLYNEKRQKDCIKLFEVSDIYSMESDIEVEKKLAIIASGRQGNNFKNFTKKIDKNYLDNLLNKLGLNFQEISKINLDSKTKNKIFYSEINISQISNYFFDEYKLNQKPINFINYKKISDLPSSSRDISFSIKDTSQVEFIIQYFDNISHRNLKNLFMFDFYKNHTKKEVKIGYRFVFQSNESTLTDDDVNLSLHEIIDKILEIKDVYVEGM